MIRSYALASLLSLSAAGCGGGSSSVESSPKPRTSVGGETGPPASGLSPAELSPAELCAAAQADLTAAEAQQRRARLEARAQEYGITVEELLEEEPEAEAEEEEAPTWSCPARDPAHYRPQPAFPPRALPDGARARLLALDRVLETGEVERFAFLAIERAGRPIHLERLGYANDPGHGQEWGQLVVSAFDAEGGVVRVTAEGLNCVPAGFDEETENEPPYCPPHTRTHLTCLIEDDVRCERAEEEVEVP